MPIPLISALPTVPSYDNTNFESLAPAFLSFLKNTFQAEMNAAIAAINSYDYGAAVNANIITGQVAVANGGTGLSELAAGRIPYGAGTGDFGNSDSFVYTSGKLGIGSTAPVRKLHIKDETNPQMRLEGAGGAIVDFKVESSGYLSGFYGIVKQLKFQSAQTAGGSVELLTMPPYSAAQLNILTSNADGRFTYQIWQIVNGASTYKTVLKVSELKCGGPGSTDVVLSIDTTTGVVTASFSGSSAWIVTMTVSII